MNRYEKTILPGGIKLLSENLPYVQSFSLGFWFNVGSRDELRRNNGITHFIEHMLFKGTTSRSAKKIADEIESYGGYLNAFTSKEHTCYYGRGLSQHLERTFGVISDMVQNPLFKENEIRKEAAVVVDELKDIDDNPEELIFDKFEEILYSGNPLGMPIIGTEKNIRNFSRQDLFDFISERYGMNNMMIAASGNIKHKDLVKFCEKYITKDLGRKSNKRKKFSPLPAPDLYLNKEIQQVHIIIGKATYGYRDRQRILVNVLSQVLGEGSSSRLFQTLREKNGIAYQLNSFLNSFYDVSSFGVYLSTNERQADRAQNLILGEFKKLREKKIPERELRKAKESIKGNLLLTLESTTARMFRMAHSEFYFNRLVTVDEITKMIESVTADELIEIANDILADDTLTRVVISSKGSIVKTAA